MPTLQVDSILFSGVNNLKKSFVHCHVTNTADCVLRNVRYSHYVFIKFWTCKLNNFSDIVSNWKLSVEQCTVCMAWSRGLRSGADHSQLDADHQCDAEDDVRQPGGLQVLRRLLVRTRQTHGSGYVHGRRTLGSRRRNEGGQTASLHPSVYAIAVTANNGGNTNSNINSNSY